MKRTASVKEKSKSNVFWIEVMTFALCLDNEGYEVSLELRKLYPVLPPESNDPMGYVRIIDESGEDYLYSAEAFEIIQLSPQIEKKLVATL